MALDCVDICDSVIEAMCYPCPHFHACQNAASANHSQMIKCMGVISMKKYPDEFAPAHP